MINLETMAKKINDVLNGTDTEIPSGLVSPANDNFFFRTFSEGLFLSEVADMNTGKNFIPVVVGAYGGENNPVAGLGEQDRNVLIQILFPVRFKAQMYLLEDYLDEIFVGRELTFGSQKAVCNLSPAQYGELQDFDFNEFNNWVENTYLQKIEKMETYMAMTITLYISTAKNVGNENGFVYGNSYSYGFSIGSIVNGAFTPNFTDDEPVFVDQADSSSSQLASQQLLGEKYSKGIAVATSYVKTIEVYVKNNSSYVWLIQKYLDRDLQGLTVQVSETYDIGTTHPTKTAYYVLNDVSMVKTKGELMSVTLTLGDKLEI